MPGQRMGCGSARAIRLTAGVGRGLGHGGRLSKDTIMRRADQQFAELVRVAAPRRGEPLTMAPMSLADDRTAIILIDHGSRRTESNDQLLEVVEAYRRHSGQAIVEPAHMEL